MSFWQPGSMKLAVPQYKKFKVWGEKKKKRRKARSNSSSGSPPVLGAVGPEGICLIICPVGASKL